MNCQINSFEVVHRISFVTIRAFRVQTIPRTSRKVIRRYFIQPVCKYSLQPTQTQVIERHVIVNRVGKRYLTPTNSTKIQYDSLKPNRENHFAQVSTKPRNQYAMVQIPCTNTNWNLPVLIHDKLIFLCVNVEAFDLFPERLNLTVE